MKIKQFFVIALLSGSVFSALANNSIINNNYSLKNAYAIVTVSNSVPGEYSLWAYDSEGHISSRNESHPFSVLPTTYITLKITNASGEWMCYPFRILKTGVGMIMSEGTADVPTFTYSDFIVKENEEKCK